MYVFTNKHFPKTNQKVYEFPMFLEQESVCISNDSERFSKSIRLKKTNVF
jgi:hypothetical protein